MEDQNLIESFVKDGHTYHCACRMTWGDGECECGHTARAENKILKQQLNELYDVAKMMVKTWDESIIELISAEQAMKFDIVYEKLSELLRRNAK